MTKLFEMKADCYGCSACVSICPKKAIHMEPDEQGFYYPHIVESLCIDCGLCDKVCQIRKETEVLYPKTETCLGIKNIDSIRKESSSGGIYTAISDYVMNKKDGGVVGVKFNDKFQVIHGVASNVEERNQFRGSKYVQSDMNDIYIQVEKYLKKQQYILFTGTPCQIAGLKLYLKTKQIDQDYLYTNDVVCHGVPSPKVWKDYISHLENKYKGKLKDFLFRDKEAGWRGYHIKVTFDNGIIINDEKYVRSYVNIFGQDCMLRPSCYFCPYSSMKRCGDITIGDFWGIENIDNDFSDNKGISMVFVNSLKGEEVVEGCMNNYALASKEYSTELLTQPNLYKSTDFGRDYDRFWQDYLKHGYKYVAHKYGEDGKFSKIRHYLNAIRIRLEKI